MARLTDAHRFFLQSFMSEYIISAKRVRELHKKACELFPETEYDKDRLVEFVKNINSSITPFHLEIRKAIGEENNQHFYGLVNTEETDITKLSSDYAVHELEFFKKLVERVVESDDACISSMVALNLPDELDPGVKKMSRKDAEDLIERMVIDKWLIDKDGMVSLSTRSILELEQYIKEQYPQLATLCDMCKKLCLKGVCCPKCDVKMHRYCALRFFTGKEQQKCPDRRCSAAWSFNLPANLGDANKSTSSSGQSSQATGTRKNNRKLSGKKS